MKCLLLMLSSLIKNTTNPDVLSLAIYSARGEAADLEIEDSEKICKAILKRALELRKGSIGEGLWG